VRTSARVGLLVLAFLLVPFPLLADNCGSLGDCYNTLRAALAALVGVATLAMLLSLGLDLLPFIGTLKGIIQAATGKDLITGEQLEDWERALGAIPGGAWAKLGGKLGKIAGKSDDLDELQILSRAELDAKYGLTYHPTKIKSWERNADGSIVKNPTLQNVNPSQPPNLDPGKKYIWAVDRDGRLLVGEEVQVGRAADGVPQRLGHPTLTNGQPTRVAGEMEWKDGGWVVNTKSGRYSGPETKRTPEQVENVINIFRAGGVYARSQP
jgi:hypothetical protein